MERDLMEPGGLRTLTVTKNAVRFLGKKLASTLKNSICKPYISSTNSLLSILCHISSQRDLGFTYSVT